MKLSQLTDTEVAQYKLQAVAKRFPTAIEKELFFKSAKNGDPFEINKILSQTSISVNIENDVS